MPFKDIESAYQDRYTFVPPSKRQIKAGSVVHFAPALYTSDFVGDGAERSAQNPGGTAHAVARQSRPDCLKRRPMLQGDRHCHRSIASIVRGVV